MNTEDQAGSLNSLSTFGTLTPGSKPGVTVSVVKDIGWREGARGDGRTWKSTYSDSGVAGAQIGIQSWPSRSLDPGFIMITQEKVGKLQFAYMNTWMRLLRGLRLETLANSIQSTDSGKSTFRIQGDKMGHCISNPGQQFRLWLQNCSSWPYRAL